MDSRDAFDKADEHGSHAAAWRIYAEKLKLREDADWNRRAAEANAAYARNLFGVLVKLYKEWEQSPTVREKLMEILRETQAGIRERWGVGELPAPSSILPPMREDENPPPEREID
jgi:hypothetical protein